MAPSKACIILIKASKVSLGLIAPTHSAYYPVPLKVSLMCINGVKLMKLQIEFPWAQDKPRKCREGWLISTSTPLSVHWQNMSLCPRERDALIAAGT